MKKTPYIAPATKKIALSTPRLICGSITSVSGNTGIEQGETQASGKSADSRANIWVWYDDNE